MELSWMFANNLWSLNFLNFSSTSMGIGWRCYYNKLVVRMFCQSRTSLLIAKYEAPPLFHLYWIHLFLISSESVVKHFYLTISCKDNLIYIISNSNVGNFLVPRKYYTHSLCSDYKFTFIKHQHIHNIFTHEIIIAFQTVMLQLLTVFGTCSKWCSMYSVIRKNIMAWSLYSISFVYLSSANLVFVGHWFAW